MRSEIREALTVEGQGPRGSIGKKLRPLIGGVAVLLCAASSNATVAYTNGPVSGTITGWTINAYYAISNSFSLSDTTTISGFSLGGWAYSNDLITSVDYGFSTSLDYVTANTAALSAGSVEATFNSYEIRNYTASIAPVTLAAGTYWFTLRNAVAPGGAAYWDQNDGPSTAFNNVLGNLAGGGHSGSEAFTLISASSPAPEPMTWAMMLTGFGVIGSSVRARRRTSQTCVPASPAR
jgi:hypothetical protein